MPLAFHGGTALRFLYGHGRYSEDLDFALEGGEPAAYDFPSGYLQAIRAELMPEGYPVELKINDQKAVHSAFVASPACFTSLAYPDSAAKCWRSSWKWIPTRQPVRD